MQQIKLIECPRDAMQGWKTFIPTETKIAYINKLLEVGFDTIDFGSFVSAKAIPQLADTADVLNRLTLDKSKSKLLAIIANLRGATDAVAYSEITYIGFPFSISETFQKLNTNSTIADSLRTVEQIQSLCANHNKQLVIYISMGFGNPYGDEYSTDIVMKWVDALSSLGIQIFAISDTVGVSNPSNIKAVFAGLQKAFPNLELGAHFHSTRETAHEKLQSAFDNHCLRFDSALNGIGGCPMAQDELVGNIATEDVLSFLSAQHIDLNLNLQALEEAKRMAAQIFI
jgi:hydroxymethylglutaryl-CoA lyase